MKLEFSRELVVLLLKILLLFFLLQVEETVDNNRNSHAPCVPVQVLNSGPLIQESVDGWMANAQSTQSGQNLVSSVHETDSSSEVRQSEVLATNFMSTSVKYISLVPCTTFCMVKLDMKPMFTILHSVFIVLFHFQTQLIPNPEHINDALPAPIHGLNGDLPIQETGQVMDQQLRQSADNHVSLVLQPSSNPHLEEDFGGEIVEVLEDYTGQIEVLVITIDSTPAIVEGPN